MIPLAEFNRTIDTIQLFREFDQNSSPRMLMFCYVARDEAQGVTSVDLVRRFEVTDATISKQLQGLTRGPDPLLRFEADPSDSRRKFIRLTDAGRRLRDQMLGAAQ